MIAKVNPQITRLCISPVFLTLAIATAAFAEQPKPATKSNEAIQVVAQSSKEKSGDQRSSSLVLSDGFNWTLVPRNSVIHPGRLQEKHLGGRPVGVLCSWEQFLTLNISWLGGMDEAAYKAITSESPNPLDLETRVIIALEDGKPTEIKKMR